MNLSEKEREAMRRTGSFLTVGNITLDGHGIFAVILATTVGVILILRFGFGI